MEKDIFFIDNNNKQMKWLSKSFIRLIFLIIDFFVLNIGALVIVFVVLGQDAIDNSNLWVNNYLTYMMLVCLYVLGTSFFVTMDMIKYIQLRRTIIVKKNNDITILTIKNTDADLNVLYGKSVFGIGKFFHKVNPSFASVALMIRGLFKMQEGFNLEEQQTVIKNINKILDERTDAFIYADYKNCKLLKENKKYYKISGQKDGVYSKFKIYKVYRNIENLNKGGN